MANPYKMKSDLKGCGRSDKFTFMYRTSLLLQIKSTESGILTKFFLAQSFEGHIRSLLCLKINFF